MEELRYVLCEVLGRPVTLYALLLTLACAVGVLMLLLGHKRTGLRMDTAEIFILLALPLGLVGARLFYCLVQWDYYREIGLVKILYLWNGGYSLWGAFGGVVIAALITAKITRQSVVKLMDALAAPAALVIALCRFAEFADGQGHGLEIAEDAPMIFQRFPFATMHPQWEIPCWAVYRLSGLVMLVICVVLLLKKQKRTGDRAKLFMVLFCSSQILLESLRADNYLVWAKLFIRVSQLTAVLVLAGMMLYALYRWMKTPVNARMSQPTLVINWLMALAFAGVDIWMQFAVQKSASIPEWLCYALMALSSAGFGVASYQLILKGTKE